MGRSRGAPCRGQDITACEEAGTEFRFGFCEWCWELLPEDLQERIHWAHEYGQKLDRRAAHRAALEHLTAVSGDQ